MDSETSTITLAFDLSALNVLHSPRDVITGSYAWADNIGILTDEPIDEVIDFKRGYRVQTDFTSGARTLSDSISDTFRMIATDRHIYVGTAESHREVAEMNNWEYLSVGQAAESAGWNVNEQLVDNLDDGSPTDGSSGPNPTAGPDAIDGIGEAYTEQLATAGVTTVEQLSDATADEISEVTSLGETRLTDWIDDATELLDETDSAPSIDLQAAKSNSSNITEIRTPTHQWHLVKRGEKEIIIRPVTSELGRESLTEQDTVVLFRGLAERHRIPVKIDRISYYDDLESIIAAVDMDRARPNLSADNTLSQLTSKHGDADEYFAFEFKTG